MTENILVKAKEIKEEISRIKNTIFSIELKKEKAERNPKFASQLFDKFPWKIRMINRKDENKEKAEIVLFNNVDSYGTTIEVDEGLIDCMIEYLKNQLEIKEKEFEEL